MAQTLNNEDVKKQNKNKKLEGRRTRRNLFTAIVLNSFLKIHFFIKSSTTSLNTSHSYYSRFLLPLLLYLAAEREACRK